MTPPGRLSMLVLSALVPGIAAAGSATQPGWAEVSAVFAERCVMCHSAVAGASRGLRLDDYAAALAGSDRGVVLIPGDAAGSELMRRILGESLPRMPFLGRPLAEEEIALVQAWIASGLPEVGGQR